MTKRKRSRSSYRKNKRTEPRVGTSSTLGRRSSTSSAASSNVSALLRYASQASGAGVGFYAGGIPGAVEGATFAGNAYDLFNPTRDSLPQKNMTNLGYGGRFNKPKSGKDAMQTALQIGSVQQIEQFGTVKDPHCVYIGHSTYQLNNISEAFRFAMIRKVLNKAGLRVINRFAELPLFSPVNSDGFKLEYVYGNPLNGFFAAATYTIVDNQNLSQVVASFNDFKTNLELFMDGDDGRQPFALHIYSTDVNTPVGTNTRLAGTVNLCDEEFHMQVTSVIKVQNRTLGDSAGTEDANVERVDSQPLIVKGYQFTNSDPRTRASQQGLNPNGNYTVLNGMHKNNVRLLRAGSDFETTTAFQNCPPKSIWNNCSKVSTSILQPGSMKQSSIYYSVKARGMKFFEKLKYQLITNDIIAGVYGRSEFLVFEEKMRTIGTNPVAVHYERKYSVGLYSLTKKGGSIVPTLTIQELNAP